MDETHSSTSSVVSSPSSETSFFASEPEKLPSAKKQRKLSEDAIGDETRHFPLESTPPLKFLDKKGSKRPLLYSENSYGLIARGRHTNHLTVECLVSVPAQIFIYDDALGGFLPFGGHTICSVNLLQQITCQQTLSPSLVQPAARNSWSADHTSSHNTLSAPSVAKVTPIWEYSIQCQRKTDSKTIVECNLAPHMTYICALPTFHHWRIGDQKFALSFGSDYSASKFHNRLQKALSHLSRQSKSTIAGSGESNLDATDDLDDDVFVTTDSSETPSALPRPWPKRTAITYTATVCPTVSVTNHLNEDVAEKTHPELFADDRPPIDPDSARPSMLTLASVSPCVNCQKCYGSPAFLSSISSENEPNSADFEFKKMSLSPKSSDSSKQKLIQSSSSSSAQEKTSTSSFKFGKMRSIRSSSNPGSIMLVQKLSAKNSRETEIAKSKSLLEAHLRNTTYANNAIRNASFELVQRERCRHCNQWYNVKDNKRGDCPDAPDPIDKWIKRLTLYSWASDFINRRLHARNDRCSSAFQGCETTCFNDNTQAFRRKAWFGLLACFVPCLCCYPPVSKIYQSKRIHRICFCCDACALRPTPHSDDISSRRSRRRLIKAAKHVPVSQKTVKSRTTSRRRFDQLHQQGSRTSSSQQIIPDPYIAFRTASGYGSLLQNSLEGVGQIIPEKSSVESTKTEKSSSSKTTRPLNSRLSF